MFDQTWRLYQISLHDLSGNAPTTDSGKTLESLASIFLVAALLRYGRLRKDSYGRVSIIVSAIQILLVQRLLLKESSFKFHDPSTNWFQRPASFPGLMACHFQSGMFQPQAPAEVVGLVFFIALWMSFAVILILFGQTFNRLV